MPTHDDRRLIAAKLRSFVTGDPANATVETFRVLYALGLLYTDNDRTYFRGCDVISLADLIEPDPYAEEIAARECRMAANWIDWNLVDCSRAYALRSRADELEAIAREKCNREVNRYGNE